MILRDFYVSRLSWRHENDLSRLTSNQNIMKHVGRGTVWSKTQLKTAIRNSVDDTARKCTRYQHFAFIHNKEVVGYARFMCKRIVYDGGEFVIRVFCKPNRVGYGTHGMKLCMDAVKVTLGESLPRAVFVAEIHQSNVRSIRFFEKKLGFVHSGLSRYGIKLICPIYPEHYVACREVK